METSTIEYEVYGFDANGNITSEVCSSLAEAKKTAAAYHRSGLIDVRFTKSDEWDLRAAWEYHGDTLVKVE